MIYIQHSSINLHFPERGGRSLAVYGAPQIPACGGPEFAFQYPRFRDAWSDTIPTDIDVLVTHTPPQCHLDLPQHMGCEWLLKECWRRKPLLHVFGHVHLGYGQEQVHWDEAQRMYERICQRRNFGLLWDMIDIFAWVNAARLLVHSILGILWNKIWGGENKQTLMVNAALMLGSTGRLGHEPQVVSI